MISEALGDGGTLVRHSDRSATADSMIGRSRVVWAGGSGARDLAGVLTNDQAVKAGSNLTASCIGAKAELLVLSNRTSFDLCSVAVPHGFDRDATRSIVAAVGGGPHSLLAATVADWLSRNLGVRACAFYGHTDPDERSQADGVLNSISARFPHMDVRAVEAANPAVMVQAFPTGALLIVGAPGGAWFQRRFFGPGARIQAKAPGGTIVVNHNPARVYQIMQAPVAYGPNMRVSDAVELSFGPGVLVADHGKLLGVVTREALGVARGDHELHEVMDSGVFLSAEDEIGEAIELIEAYDGGIVPVIDDQARLVGRVSARDLPTRSLK